MSRLAVPKNRYVVNVECHLVVVGQERPSTQAKGNANSATNATGKVRKPL
jgi:hypothetical protein